MNSHTPFLERAIALAIAQCQAGAGGPFGAVVVREGVIIAEGWNQVTSTHDPTAHAEIVAIRRACAALGRFSLAGCTLYSSCEPCPMCLGAVYWARLDGLHYAATRQDAASAGFDDALIYRELPLPPGARRLPTVHHPLPESTAPFAAWNALAHRIPY